jgi:hypothetical protein
LEFSGGFFAALDVLEFTGEIFLTAYQMIFVHDSARLCDAVERNCYWAEVLRRFVLDI